MSKIETKLTLSGLLKANLIKFSGFITSPVNHKGFYNLCKIFSLISSKEDTIKLRLYKDCVYEIIFKDPYWNRLISNTYHYEPEILFLLDYLKKVKFSFVDVGLIRVFGV